MSPEEIKQANALLDSILNTDDELVSAEQVAIMRRLREANNKLVKGMERAKRAGLSMDGNIERAEENARKITTFLREFG